MANPEDSFIQLYLVTGFYLMVIYSLALGEILAKTEIKGEISNNAINICTTNEIHAINTYNSGNISNSILPMDLD